MKQSWWFEGKENNPDGFITDRLICDRDKKKVATSLKHHLVWDIYE